MKSRVTVLAALSWLVAATPAAAQKPGSVEIGGFARFTDYDNSLPIFNGLGVGGRVAAQALPRLGVEVNYSSTSSEGVKHTPLRLMAVYSVPADPKTDILVGFGYVRNKYTGAYDATDSGLSGFVGVRYRVGNMLALRLDGGEDFVWNPANSSYQSAFNGNWGISAGLSVLLNQTSRSQ
jgi:hypothetical protein